MVKLLQKLTIFSIEIPKKNATIFNISSKFTSANVSIHQLKNNIMAKSQDAKKTVKKEPVKTAKEKKQEKREKKPKYD